MSTLDDLLSGGGKSFKFDHIGASVTGVIVAMEVKQKTEFGTGKLLTWDDGRPQEQIMVSVKTNERDPDDDTDDGVRTVWVKGWGDPLKAFRAAVAALGRKPAIGDTFTATYIADGPANGLTPPKVFSYAFKPGTPGLDRVLGSDQPAAAPAVLPQAPATPATYAGPTPQDIATAKTLLAAGLTDDVIRTSAPTVSAEVLAALRNALTAA
jgi:hypothetical protein